MSSPRRQRKHTAKRSVLSTKTMEAHGKGRVLATKTMEADGKGRVLATKAVAADGKALSHGMEHRAKRSALTAAGTRGTGWRDDLQGRWGWGGAERHGGAGSDKEEEHHDQEGPLIKEGQE